MKKTTFVIILAILSLSVIGLLKLSNTAKSYMEPSQTDSELIEILESGHDVDFMGLRE